MAGDQASESAGLPHFPVRLTAPDLSLWIAGNTGVPGFTSFVGPQPGPHVAVVALTHGNELAGAIVLDRLLRDPPRPARGRLTLGFANLAAFERFDPRHPTGSRFIDEDLNRVWDTALLDGTRRSVELDRARAMRPLIDTVDVLLDLHSMLWPSDPLILCGQTPRGRDLARRLGVPPLVVADAGHVSGRRMIDYAGFTDPGSTRVAILVEAGQHWEQATVETTSASVAALLAPPAAAAAQGLVAEVTQVVTAQTAGFQFVRAFRGGEIIPVANTLVALDGTMEVRTPHDDCLLVMPSLRPGRGHTAVRMARFIN